MSELEKGNCFRKVSERRGFIYSFWEEGTEFEIEKIEEESGCDDEADIRRPIEEEGSPLIRLIERLSGLVEKRPAAMIGDLADTGASGVSGGADSKKNDDEGCDSMEVEVDLESGHHWRECLTEGFSSANLRILRFESRASPLA